MAGARQPPLREALPDLARHLAGTDYAAVASWRCCDRELDEFDRACFAAGVRWCGAYPSEDRLICGPLIIPGSGPCFRCFRRRYLSHHPAPERDLCLQRAYDRDPHLGVAGFIAPMAWTAASILVAAGSSEPSEAGRLIEVNLFDAGFLHTRVIAVRSCTRCRSLISTRAGDRFVNRIRPAVEDLLA
jgi:bacteriocin biosynthesis cyclodehydratase domain-containing protein